MDRSLPAGNILRKNSPYVIEGEFYKPDTVLEVIAESKKIEEGVIEIMGPKLGGHLLVKNNSIITDAVVGETNETGTAAVCRLLLMPHGIFSFRRANPTDKPMYQQDMNISFDEAKKFLAGPSSIGLGFPGKTTLHNLKALTGESKLTNPDYAGDGLEEEIEDMEYIGPEVVSEFEDRNDYKQLVDAVSEKRRETMEIIRKEKQDQTTLESLKKPGPLPSRKEEFKVDRKLVATGVVMVFGVLVASAVVDVLHNPHKQEKVAETVGKIAEAPAKQLASTPKQPQGRAPFAFPSASSEKKAPPNPKRRRAKREYVPTVASTISQTVGAPNLTDLGHDEITRWKAELRSHPSDISAKRELAQAYLLRGDTTSSIKEFYSIMKLKNVESSEIITYANNLMVYGSPDISKQFLRNILRSDPARKAIRERLSEMR